MNPGDDLMFPHLQFSRWYKNDIPRNPSPPSSLFPPARIGDSLHKATLPYPIQVLKQRFLHLEHKDQDLLRTTIADNNVNIHSSVDGHTG
jgi:hypothetical protein